MGRYPKRSDKDGVYIPEVYTCVHFTGEDAIYGIKRKAEHPYWESAAQYGVNHIGERKRRDLWVMPEDESGQELFLQELTEQIQTHFLDCYRRCTDTAFLEELIVGRRLAFNQKNGYQEGAPFSPDSYIGNWKGYLNYAVLFHQHYGTEKEYAYYLKRLEEWSLLHKKSIPSRYYCGVSKKFEL